MHLGAASVAVSGWWKSILDGGYSGASSHISLDMNLRLRSTCRSSPFGFSFLVSFVLLPATSTVVRRQYLPASLQPNPDLSPSSAVSPDSSILFRLASLSRFLPLHFAQKTLYYVQRAFFKFPCFLYSPFVVIICPIIILSMESSMRRGVTVNKSLFFSHSLFRFFATLVSLLSLSFLKRFVRNNRFREMSDFLNQEITLFFL